MKVSSPLTTTTMDTISAEGKRTKNKDIVCGAVCIYCGLCTLSGNFSALAYTPSLLLELAKGYLLKFLCVYTGGGVVCKKQVCAIISFKT